MKLKNFNASELSCPCCNINGVTEEAGNKLQELRDLFGTIFLSSAYRCDKYNKSINGGSTHPRGIAFDVRVSGMSESKKLQLLEYASELGFNGIGTYDRHIHIDLRKKKAFWIGVSK